MPEQETQDKLEQQLKSTHPETLHARIDLLDSRMKVSELLLGFIVWNVGLITPGLLGLLWNGQALRHASILTPELFMKLYFVTQGMFVGSVVCTLAMYMERMRDLLRARERRHVFGQHLIELTRTDNVDNEWKWVALKWMYVLIDPESAQPRNGQPKVPVKDAVAVLIPLMGLIGYAGFATILFTLRF
jgi:hypothetical protein